MNNILLTGANGFLGSHILRDLLIKSDSKIYCIIRGENAESKLNKSIKHYFEDKEYFYKFNDIILINGDIGQENFAINSNEYETLTKNIDIIINAAGLTKHYGNYQEFYNANIKTIENLIEFSKIGKSKKIYHVSTMSVSGQFLCEENITQKCLFDEKSLDIGQNIEQNVYIKSKYIAEEKMNEYFKNGGMGSIIRVGNLTCRFEDGKKQLDVQNNAFTNRFLAFYNIGYVFHELESLDIEFSPVDMTSKAVVLIVENQLNERVFHIYNNNYIKFGEILKDTKKLKKEDFLLALKKDMLEKPTIRNFLPYIINDLSQSSGYITNIENNNEYSNTLLKKIGFEWPKIDKNYIELFFKTFC